MKSDKEEELKGKHAPQPPITDGYVRYLLGLVDEKELFAATSAFDRNHAFQLRRYGSAYRIYEAVSGLLGRSIAPPCVPIDDEVEHDWLIMGRLLRKANPDAFSELFDKLMKGLAKKPRRPK